ncbi:hypothetical protein MFLAVUS_011521, partial [Mucor flavus]
MSIPRESATGAFEPNFGAFDLQDFIVGGTIEQEEESGSEYVPSDVEYDEGYDDDDNVAVAEEEETDDAAVEDMDIVNPFDFVKLTFNEYVDKCIQASTLGLDVQVDLHLNGIICDDQGVKHRLNVSMLEREIEQQDFAVSQDIDALIA